jgi:hypothetical protein
LANSLINNEQSSPSSSRSVLLLLVTALCVPPIALAVSLLRLKDSWDDGAITAAISRTFANTGVIALTPLSPKVEGFSSISWFFLLSTAHLFSNHASAYLIWMKVLSALFFFLSLPVFFYLCRRLIGSLLLSAFATWLLALTLTPFYETFNGMEMNLALFLFLSLVYVLTSYMSRGVQFITAWVITALLLATRFEAPYMLLALLFGLLLSQGGSLPVPSRRFLFSLLGASLLVFAGIALWRHHMFGVWMPNTVYAKLWWPYQPAKTLRAFLQSRGDATAEIFVVLFAPIVVGVFEVIRSRTAVAVQPVAGALSVAGLLYGLVFGQNLGHRGRMTECFLPFLIVLLLNFVSSASRNRTQLYRACVVIAVLHLGLWTALAYRLMTRSYGQTIASFEVEGSVPDRIRRVLHRNSLTILIPDVGGASLCCEHLRILDIALLTNPVLAHRGYKDFNAYFKENNPDVVEAHEVWAEASNIYGSGLLDGYSLVESENMGFFVRNDLYTELVQDKAGEVRSVENVPSCLGSAPRDQAFSRMKMTCLELNDKAR